MAIASSRSFGNRFPVSCFSFLENLQQLLKPLVRRNAVPFGKRETSNGKRFLYSAAFRRTAAVVRHRRHVADSLNVQPCCRQSTDRRLASRSRTAHADFHRAHAVVARHVGRVLRGLLRSERRAFARTAEAERTRALPAHGVALRVRNGHDGVVERRLDMHDAEGNVLAFLLLELLATALAFFL